MVEISSKNEKSVWVGCLLLTDGMVQFIECLISVVVIGARRYVYNYQRNVWHLTILNSTSGEKCSETTTTCITGVTADSTATSLTSLFQGSVHTLGDQTVRVQDVIKPCFCKDENTAFPHFVLGRPQWTSILLSMMQTFASRMVGIASLFGLATNLAQIPLCFPCFCLL